MDSRAVNKFEASLTDDPRVIIYDRHMFIDKPQICMEKAVRGCLRCLSLTRSTKAERVPNSPMGHLN